MTLFVSGLTGLEFFRSADPEISLAAHRCRTGSGYTLCKHNVLPNEGVANWPCSSWDPELLDVSSDQRSSGQRRGVNQSEL